MEKARIPHRGRGARAALVALAALLVLPGCGRLGARMKLREGNASYKARRWSDALAAYDKVPAHVPERLRAQLGIAYTWMSQYRWGSRLPVDRERAQNAVRAFEEYLKILPAGTHDPHLPGPEKVDDWIIQLLVDSERYEDAIARLEAQLARKPGDPAIQRGLAQAYEKWGKAARALEEYRKWAELFKNDPAPHVLIGAQCWNVSFRQASLLDPLERNRYIDYGLASIERALQIDPNSFEGLTYKNLLLRERAKMRVDPDIVANLMTQAIAIHERVKVMAEERKKQKEAEKAKAARSPAPGPAASGG